MHNLNDTPALSIFYAEDGLPIHYRYNGKVETLRFNHPARPRYREINEACVSRFKKIIGKGNYVYVPAAGNSYNDIEEALEALEKLKAN